jgi:heat shock protein HslJ
MEQETAYLAGLEAVTAWVLTEEGRLELTYDSGQPYEEKLVYTAGQAPLAGTTWRLVSFGDPDDPQEVEEGTAVTVAFSPETDTTGTLGGNATCNSYTGSYTLDGERITIGPLASTMMLCPVGADQETAFLAALGAAQSYQIVGPHLQITFDRGVLNFTSLSLPLENVLWRAAVVGGEMVPDEIEITALFTPGEEQGEGAVGGSAGCNSYNAAYETDGETLTIPGPMAVTRKLCPDRTTTQLENTYLGILEAVESYEVLGDSLVLKSEQGEIQYAADRQPLEGTLWSLVSLGDVDNPQPPVEGSDFTAQFSRDPTLPTGTVVGTTGCNEWNATYTANLSEIKVNLPSKTKNEECPWGTGNFEVEQQFFLGLNSATSYRIVGGMLQIVYGEAPNQQVLNFAATQPPVEEVLDLTPLANTFWYLTAIGEQSVLPGVDVTAQFAINEDGVTGTMGGSAGCNSYSAEIGRNFAISPIATTQRACSQAVMDQEQTYLSWLATAYTYSRAGDQLLIPTANGVLTYGSQPVLDQSRELQNVTWWGVSYETSTPVRGSEPTAFFNPDGRTLSGKTGCNDYQGTYSAGQGNTLTISGLTSTKAACASDALRQQEQGLLNILGAATSYSVSGTQLQIRTAQGGTLNLSSNPPEPVGPKAVIAAPTSGLVGEVLVFDGYQSQAGSTPIVSFEWRMGDGTKFFGPVYEYSYDTPGTYEVSLEVLDEAALRHRATHMIQINAAVQVQPPKAAIEGPGEAFVGDAVTFSAAGSQQGTAEIKGYQWQSGDGNDTAVMPENSFTTVYGQPGTHYPSVLVVDVANQSDSASMQIVIHARLEGTAWGLQNAIPGTHISVDFANGVLSGFAGCNTYNASYTSTRAGGPSNEIQVGPMANTGQICSEEIMQQEQAYLASLQTANRYTISGSMLTLETPSGPLLYSAALAVPLSSAAQ